MELWLKEFISKKHNFYEILKPHLYFAIQVISMKLCYLGVCVFNVFQKNVLLTLH